MASFFTRGGDDGFSGLLGEGRVLKSDARLEALGAVDEATAALGLARAQCRTPEIAEIILHVQRDLYKLMAEVAATPEAAKAFRVIGVDHVAWLEAQTESTARSAQYPSDFIIPGDSQAAAALDLARTIVRRAERRMAQLLHASLVENIELLRYLNRLSSLCFVLELLENQAAGQNAPTLMKPGASPA